MKYAFINRSIPIPEQKIFAAKRMCEKFSLFNWVPNHLWRTTSESIFCVQKWWRCVHCCAHLISFFVVTKKPKISLLCARVCNRVVFLFFFLKISERRFVNLPSKLLVWNETESHLGFISRFCFYFLIFVDEKCLVQVQTLDHRHQP